MERGVYVSEARSWSNTHLVQQMPGRMCWQSLLQGMGEGGELTSYRGIDVRWAH